MSNVCGNIAKRYRKSKVVFPKTENVARNGRLFFEKMRAWSGAKCGFQLPHRFQLHVPHHLAAQTWLDDWPRLVGRLAGKKTPGQDGEMPCWLVGWCGKPVRKLPGRHRRMTEGWFAGKLAGKIIARLAG